MCRRRSRSSTRTTASTSSTSTKVESVVDNGSSVTVTYTGKDGQQSSIEAGKVLMSVGFAPEHRGLRPREHRSEADRARRHRHRRPHAHQCRGHLRHRRRDRQAAARPRGRGSGRRRCRDDRRRGDPDAGRLPHDAACDVLLSQVASFGLTEQQAKDEGREIKVATFPFMANGKAHGLGEPVGFVKLIADAEHLELIGAHMIGPDVSELLPELTAGSEVGSDGTGAGPQRAHAPDAVGGAAGGLPRPRRPHDQLLISSSRRPGPRYADRAFVRPGTWVRDRAS